MIQWQLVKLKIKDLKEHPRNPRILSSDQGSHLQKSIEGFGLIDKPIVNLDNMLIGGHQRVKILKKMKHKEVECWIPDRMLADKEVDELCVRLNKNTGDWNYETLANEWEAGDLIEWGFSIEDLFGKDKPEKEEAVSEEEKEEEHKISCPGCGLTFNPNQE